MYRFKLYVLDNEADANTVSDTRGTNQDILPLMAGEADGYATAIYPMNVTKVVHPEIDKNRLFTLPSGTVIDGGLQVDFPYEQIDLAKFIADQPAAKEIWDRCDELWIVVMAETPELEPYTGFATIWEHYGHITEENGYYRIEDRYSQFGQESTQFVTTSYMG